MTVSDPKPAKKTKAKPAALYLTARRLVDPATGNIVGAFVPNSEADKHFLRERGYKNGELVRAVFSKPRNPRFNRLVHGMGRLIVENLEGYEGLRAHDAIKKLQVHARIHCDIELLTFAGMEVSHFVPKSISYDSMDEHTFQNFWSECCNYLIDKHWHDLDEEDLTNMIEFTSFNS